MGTYEIKHGDLFADFQSIPGDIPIIIPHVCNNMGAWGKGFTEAIDDNFPYAAMAYLQEYELSHFEGGLGGVIRVPISRCSAITHMVAQIGLRSKVNPKPLSYPYLEDCMKLVKDMANNLQAGIMCPMFGAGLAGGDWETIEEMIHYIWVNEGIRVTVWEL